MGAVVCKVQEVDRDLQQTSKTNQTDCCTDTTNDHGLDFFFSISADESKKPSTQRLMKCTAGGCGNAQDMLLSSKRHMLPKTQSAVKSVASSDLKDADLTHVNSLGLSITRKVSVKNLKPLPSRHQDILIQASMSRKLATPLSWKGPNTAVLQSSSRIAAIGTEWKSRWKSADF